MGLSTLRGSGPPPPGFYRCTDPKCPARRSPSSGKFGKSGGHYHPLRHPQPEGVPSDAQLRRERENPYSPKTGARCSCRPGVQRDNCPRCEGTGWVIDFKKIHERKNPARWAHGIMSYRQPPGSVIPMTNNPRGGQFYLNRRRRRNPYRRNPGRGGTNWLLIGGLAAGAFFLLPKLMGTAGANPLAALFGGTAAGVPAGYTPIGNGLYRAPNGAIVARNPQTGQMVMAPAGSVPTSAEDLLTRAGISLIPSTANILASWVGSLFSTQQTSTGAVVGLPGGTVGGAGGTVTAPDVLSGSYLPPDGLPPLVDLPTYPVFDWATIDSGSYAYDAYELPGLPPMDYDVMIGVGTGEITIANPADWSGFFGLGSNRGGRRPRFMGGVGATPPVY